MSNSQIQRVALVTGANRGIGLEIARQLAQKGLKVVLTSRQPEQGEKVAADLAAEGLTVYLRPLDVDQTESVERLKTSLETEFGRLDVLVNNAAILLDRRPSASQIDLEIVKQTFETNLFGAWRMCQAFIPLMKKEGYGRIVNVSSGAGAFSDIAGSNGGWPAYNLSKTALNALTASLASELRGANILVNAVCPGWVRTDMGGANADRAVEKGAETPVWLATLPDDGPTGGFFRDRQIIPW
jgi:NAD(P)-dependent dehydrogenase (short-subunit alcohol dehydrogenase family)